MNNQAGQSPAADNWASGLPVNWREVEWKGGAASYAESIAFQEYADGRIELKKQVEPFFSVGEAGVTYNFHAGQSRVMQSVKRFVIACAGRQGGKSECGPPWLLDEIMARGPGWYMVVAPSFPLLEDSALPKFMNLFKLALDLGELKHNPLRFIVSREGEKFLYQGTRWEGVKNLPQTVIRFGHGSSAAGLEAKTALAVWIDEGGQREFKPESFEAIEGRVTTTLGRILISTTPYELNWLYRKFYLPAKKADFKHPHIDFINWPSYYNPAFPREEYDRLKESQPAWKHAMFYDGVFTRPAGQIYDCFSEDNIVDPFPIPDHWPLMLGMDFGGSNTAALTIAQDPDTLRLYAFSEYLGGNKEPSEHIRAFTAQNPWHKSPDGFDRAFGGQKSEGSWRMWYRAEGIYLEEPPISGGGSVELGIDAVYSFVQKDIFKVFRSCEGTIEQFQTYSREIDPETGEPKAGTIDDKGAYHFLDAIRYLLGGLSRTSAVYEAALQRAQMGPEERYIEQGDKRAREFFDPRHTEDDDYLEGEVVDEADYGDMEGWQQQNGIFVPSAGVIKGPIPSPMLGVGSGPFALPLPFQ